jgi:tetratricopeptide (TPR) repeat protein
MSLLCRFLTSFVLLLLLAVAIAQDNNPINRTKEALLEHYKEADRFFNEAEKTDDEEKQDLLNQKALEGFKAVLPGVSQLKNDSLTFNCYFNIGILEHSSGNYSEANKNYNAAIQFIKNPSLKDSVFFRPLLYSGIIYYQQSQFDSALQRYHQAEAIADGYSGKLKETERLFNNLGVLYYETGNYKQAKNYFEKAIEVLQPSNIYYKALLVNYKINLAQVLTRLQDYNAAYSIYQSLIVYNINKDEIYHNLGTISLDLGAANEALDFFRKVNYTESNIAKLHNDIGYAFYNLGQYDSASLYLQKATTEDAKRNGTRKSVVHGLTLKYSGDVLTSERSFKEAIKCYQQAIIQFVEHFNDSSISSAPDKFGGVFSYINCFDALTAKAFALENLYENEKNKEWLIVALNTYTSAFELVDHVQKTYESDEARLFLNQTKYKVHARPVDVAIELYELTKDQKFLEEAYRFDQLNKASVLSLSLQETSLQQQAGVSDEFLKGIAKIKSQLTQLSLRATKFTDSVQQKEIADQLRDNEILLGKLQEKINANPKYAQLQPADLIPPVSYLQKKFLDPNTLLVSYHFSENEMLCLYFTRQQFNYVKQKIGQSFFNKLDSFTKALHNVGGGEKYKGETIAASLYSLLLQPVLKKVNDIKRIIIVPDDELNYLPFEALQDENKKFLVESFSIQYQYSTALLHLEEDDKIASSETLGIAPFTENVSDSFQKLGHSKQELASLKGKILLGTEANKNNFLRLANHYSIIHLATHARVDDHAPLQSFIAFYPGKKDSAENFKLYAREIYGLKLDSTQLIIMSACETGTGLLVRGEGLMSLSRAFAYAGCPNIITSLWKAEDKTTAFIMERLHYYLEKNFTIDAALQKAKIDLLRSNEIDPRLKSPNYWAHLVFIGNYQKEKSSNNWWWVAGLIIILSAIALIKKKKPR